jgi:predicted amidohydrolase
MHPSDHVEVACVQLDLGDTPPVDRLAQAVEAVESIARADLVVLPELWPTGYFSFERYADTAEPLDGPTVTAMAELARRRSILLVMGSFVERGDDGLANCAVLLGPDGDVELVYRKIHLFGYGSEEARLLTPGADAPVARTEIGGVAVTTCYDLRFPELYRALVDRGAEIVVVPAAWPAARLEHWRLLVRARALEEQVYLVACNVAGTQGDVVLGGHSAVVSPWGEVVAEAGAGAEVLRARISPAAVASTRAEFPVLEHRRIPVDATALGDGQTAG